MIGTDSVTTWRDQVLEANLGLVLLQTKSVLHHPVRLLQIFEAVNLSYAIVCVNVVGGRCEPRPHAQSRSLTLTVPEPTRYCTVTTLPTSSPSSAT